MTCWRLFPTYIRRVAISTLAGFLELLKFGFDSYSFRIRRLLAFSMTRRAGIDRNIRRQSAHRCRARDVDVAGRAFHHVLALAAFVIELR